MNQIRYNNNGDATSFSGAKAVDVFRVAALSSALGMLSKGLKMRGVTLTSALKIAGEYTGKKYKRTDAEKAREDLKAILADKKTQVEHITN